jgi:hypothetical protein
MMYVAPKNPTGDVPIDKGRIVGFVAGHILGVNSEFLGAQVGRKNRGQYKRDYGQEYRQNPLLHFGPSLVD